MLLCDTPRSDFAVPLVSFSPRKNILDKHSIKLRTCAVNSQLLHAQSPTYSHPFTLCQPPSFLPTLLPSLNHLLISNKDPRLASPHLTPPHLTSPHLASPPSHLHPAPLPVSMPPLPSPLLPSQHRRKKEMEITKKEKVPEHPSPPIPTNNENPINLNNRVLKTICMRPEVGIWDLGKGGRVRGICWAI